MAIETSNFIFGEDFRNKTLPEFKAHMKKYHRVGAKEAKKIYEEIHGEPERVPEKDSEIIES